ncbi:MAG: SpoIIE family protein phosphatase [Planctomycetaceae bacterium]|nr:SpoIIE family protein phosphatase [Planctomycetaceae bacterium]
MRILVGWDDQQQAELMKAYLSVNENTVSVTCSTDQLLSQVRGSQIWDVILLTTSHPDHDSAFAIFEEIRALLPDVPIVGACPQDGVYRIARYLTSGMRSYLIRDANADYMFLLQAILESAVHQVQTERERQVSEQLRKEVESVRELQESIIPRNITTPDGFHVRARYESSQIRVIGSKPVVMAGGDYYESFTLANNQIVALIGDASGHGIKACMSILTMHTLIRMIQIHDYLDGAKLVHHINNQLCRHSILSNDGGFITLLYGVLTPETREFRWASAGHNMPLVHNLDTDEIYEVASAEDASGLPLGIFEDTDYVTQSTIIPPHCRLMLYTDGLIEAFPANREGAHEEFGMDGVYRTLRACRAKSLDECLESLFQASYEFTEGAGRHDDTSVLLIQCD